MKTALITGVTGQDGSYLSEFLLEKKYKVVGLRRRSSSFNSARIDHLLENENFVLEYGDVTDTVSIGNVVKKHRPDEIYNLAAQSHVAVSFETPEYTANADALGTLRILEQIRSNDLQKSTKFYQAGTSELFGKVVESPQTERTPFYPRSPYGVAKLFAHWITINYRESYDIFAVNGILFNHESKRRGENFVTRKITRAIAKLLCGKQKELVLGNLDARRDWGHAKDFVEMQWLMLQQETPEDYVIATGMQKSVREFIEETCSVVGYELEWRGTGINEIGYLRGNQFGNKWTEFIRISEKYFRPAEVESLLGDASKARKRLGWEPKYTFRQIVEEMIESDIAIEKS